MTNFEKVIHWHKVFGTYRAKEPSFPDPGLVSLRLKLIDEEVAELIDGVNKADLANTAKELADILYVVYGFADCLGIDLDHAFDLVHESNMSKLGDDGKPVKREDGKILKGPNYKPVDDDKIVKAISDNATVSKIYVSYLLDEET